MHTDTDVRELPLERKWTLLEPTRYTLRVEHVAAGTGKNHLSKQRWIAASACFIAVFCGLIVGKSGFRDLKNRFIPNNWGVVEADKIYRSGQLHRALVRETLQKSHIRVVIDLTNESTPGPDHQAEENAIRELGLEGHRFPLNSDGTGEPLSVAQAVSTLVAARESGKPALVHCTAGVQRAGCVIATYQLLVRGNSPHDVLAEMQSHGWKPREGKSKLLKYLNAHLPEIAEHLVELGTLSKMPESIPVLTAD